MLNFENNLECESPILEMDDYIPFAVELGSDSSQLLYWRAGDGKLSLIEIGLKAENGAVHSVTLTSINPRNVKETENSIKTDLIETYGIPVFDTSNWNTDSSSYSDNFRDDFSINCSLVIGQDYLALDFCDVDKPSQYIRNKR